MSSICARIAVFSLASALLFGPGCGAIPVDASVSEHPPAGGLRGSVVYQGPAPCSRAGKIVGNAILLVFDATNPPPPAGVAATPVNFVVVPGEQLFGDLPRSQEGALDCPDARGDKTVLTRSAVFAVSPLAAGSYTISGFYDRRGEFLPTLKVRNLPRAGDIGGGLVDVADAQAHADDANYRPKYLPIDIGVRAPSGAFELPADGFVATGVTVTLGLPLGLARPYFYQEDAAAAGDPYAPAVQFAQDHALLAPPRSPTPASAGAYEARFPKVRLRAGVAPEERTLAIDPTQPFHLQLPANGEPGLFLWRDGKNVIVEGQVPTLWPLVAFTKLVDDPTHLRDVQATTSAGGRDGPIVVLQGLTVAKDHLLDTVLAPPAEQPGRGTLVDHVTALVRPAALCFNGRKPGAGALLVVPYLEAESADPADPPGPHPLFDAATLVRNSNGLVRKVVRGCLPPGSYAVNVVYPSGQAWTVPNEAGSCALAEGTWDSQANPSRCSEGGRPVLRSQGPRGALAVTASPGSTVCRDFPVPKPCLENVEPERF